MVTEFSCPDFVGVPKVPVHVVYVDQVILGSIVMNYVILRTVGKIGGVEKERWRLVIAAALGGFYSIVAFVPDFSALLTVWFKTLVSLVIIFIAFAPQPPVRLAVCLAFFYLTSFALGGSIIGIMYFLEARGGIFSVPGGFPRVMDRYFWYAVILALAGFWAAGRGTSILFKRRYSQNLFKVSLTIKMQGKQVRTEGFLDSGNQLTDPLTGNPVIVAEYEVIQELLPGELVAYLNQNKGFDPVQALVLVKDNPRGSKFRLIPFQSLGADSGMLLGFNPDEVELERGDGTVRSGRVTIAIYHKKLSHDSAYHVLVHPCLLEVDIY